MVNVTLGRIDEDLHQELRRRATASGRSMRKFIVHYLREQLLETRPVQRATPAAPSTKHHPGFEAWWQAYPRKVGKGAAQILWDRHRPDPGQALAALDNQREWNRVQWADPKLIPHPSTWLNQHRWLDEPPERRRDVAYDEYLANLVRQEEEAARAK